MHATRLALATAALSALATAQDPAVTPKPRVVRAQYDRSARVDEPRSSQAELREYLATKLAKDFVTKTPWLTDYDAARRMARECDRPIFAYFTRSYAHCGACEVVEHSLLSDAAFTQWAAGVVPLLHVASHIEGVPYDDLMEEKGFGGYPSLAILDAEGRLIARPRDGERRDLAGLVALEQRAREHLALRARAASGEPDVRAELFLAELELGDLAPAAARAELDALAATLDASERTTAVDRIRAISYRKAVLEIRRAESTDERRRLKLTDLALVTYAQGEVPTRNAPSILVACGEHAWATKDADLLRRVIADYEPLAEHVPGGSTQLQRMRERLAEIEALE